MTSLPPINKKQLQKAFSEMPKVVKQKEKAAKEKVKALKSFAQLSQKLKKSAK